MIYCIVFERELEGKDFIHHEAAKKPTYEEAIEIIKANGYNFSVGYDEVRLISEVKTK